MLICSHCGATYPRKINKINGLPQKNQRDTCSEKCWHAKLRAQKSDVLNARRREIYKPTPRSARSKRYHCCEHCGKESMKVIDPIDANKFCSLECSFESKRMVTSERNALLRIGINYDRARYAAGMRLAASLRKASSLKARAQSNQRLKSLACHVCGRPISYLGIGTPNKYCSDACLKNSDAFATSRRAGRRKRRAAKLNRTVQWSDELNKLVWSEASRLVSMRRSSTGIDWDADHMIPLRAESCSGLHVWNNCQVIPSALNSIKSNAMAMTEPLEWLSCMP